MNITLLHQANSPVELLPYRQPSKVLTGRIRQDSFMQMNPSPLFILVIFLTVLSVHIVLAQPMSGSFTVGGASPDFVTLQDAANAVKARGVSGAVFFNIRPGIYTRDGGAGAVLVIDSTITGVSPTNRITFQPDTDAGGNVDNTILRVDFDSNSNRRSLAIVRSDYTTIRNLTFEDADSMDTPVATFIDAGIDNANLSIESLEVDGCKFIGTPFFPQFGTDIGIGSYQNVASASYRHNQFYRVCRAITNVNDSNRGGDFIVEDNEFYQGYLGSTGTGNQLGTAIELACTHASIRRNIIDLAGGWGAKAGIEVIFPTSAVIERNLIKNRVAIGGPFDNFTGISVRNPSAVFDSVLIANNAIVANRAWVHTYCMKIETPNTKILYNTIVDAALGGGDNIGLIVTGENCTVLDNIILELSDASYVAFDQGNTGSALNLVSDHNILFIREDAGASGLVRRNGTMFTSLAGYQAGSGLDTNSVSKSIIFADLFHLDSCQAQDPDLNGIPVPGITADFDGAVRDTVKPFKGADESVRIPFDMFADGFRVNLPGAPLSLAAGDFFDNDDDADIAVPDYDNRQILLFRNLQPTRSFVQSGTLSASVQPGVIKLFDFDEDGHLDLIAGGDEAAVDVFWGNAGGGFDDRVTVETFGRVRSLEPEPYRAFDTGQIIWITEDNGFLPNTGFLGYLQNIGGRQLCHDVNYQDTGIFWEQETLSTVMTDLVVGDMDVNSGYELASLSISPLPSKLVIFTGLDELVEVSPECGDAFDGFLWLHNEHNFGTASYVGHNSSIVMGDFDGDEDNDLLTTSASENSCILIRNHGNLTFSTDTIPAEFSRGLVALDYENDGDLDFVTTNRTLYDHGITVFLNDGLGHFTEKPNCFFPFASGFPNGIVAEDFDLDGKTDIAIASSFDSLFVIYNLGGFNATTGIEDHPRQQLSLDISLAQNYPNPFNPATTFRYHLTQASRVRLRIYNVLGQVVTTLTDAVEQAGFKTVHWTAANVASGVYFYRLEVISSVNPGKTFVQSRKMILLK